VTPRRRHARAQTRDIALRIPRSIGCTNCEPMMIRFAAGLLVVLWPRSPLARDEQPPAIHHAARARHGPKHAQRTIVVRGATPDGPRVRMVLGD